jgi:hypothetical protein
MSPQRVFFVDAIAAEAVVSPRGLCFYVTASEAGNVWVGGILGFGDSDWERRWNGAHYVNHDTVFGLAFPGGFDLWAGGTAQVWYFSGRAIWQFTGTAWQEDLAVTNGSSGFFAGTSASDLYCFLGGTSSGLGSLLARYWDGSAWSAVLGWYIQITYGAYYHVHAWGAAITPSGQIYVAVRAIPTVSLDGVLTVGYLDSTNLYPGLLIDFQRNIFRVWAADDDNVFALTQYTAGGTNEYLVYQGSFTTWATVDLPTAPTGHVYRWNDVRGVSADDYWVVGEDELEDTTASAGVAAHYESGTWTVYTIPATGGGAHLACNALAVVATDDVWIAVDASTATISNVPTVYHWDGTAWSERSPFA